MVALIDDVGFAGVTNATKIASRENELCDWLNDLMGFCACFGLLTRLIAYIVECWPLTNAMSVGGVILIMFGFIGIQVYSWWNERFILLFLLYGRGKEYEFISNRMYLMSNSEESVVQDYGKDHFINFIDHDLSLYLDVMLSRGEKKGKWVRQRILFGDRS